MDLSDRKRRSRKSGCSRNRRSMIGGTYTAAYSFGPAVAAGAPYASTVIPTTDCGSPNRVQLNTGPTGLPGMSGGRKRSRRHRHNNMMGGRYGFEPEIVGSGIALGGRPSIPCEASVNNSLNPGPATVSTLPRQSGGVGGPDSMFHNAPTAGYTFMPSDRMGGGSGTLTDGKIPFAVNVPYEAHSSNRACSHTGGRRRKSRKVRKARKSRKSRKVRKSRKSNRRN